VACRDAVADPRCDSVVCAVVGVFEAVTLQARIELEQVARGCTKPVVAVLLDFEGVDDDGEGPDELGGLPIFDAPADAVHALSAVTAYAHWRERDPGAVPLLEVDEQAAKRIVNRVLAKEPRGRELTDVEARELLGAYGVVPLPRYGVRGLEQAIEVAERLGWNVVLKATAEAVRGRPDLASVYRNLESPQEMAEAWRELGRLVHELALETDEDLSVAMPVVQRMAPAGVPLVVTSREDAAFGPIVSLGLAGIASELLGDTVYRVPPLTTVDAAVMVRDLRAAPTLFGRHGSPGVDVASVQDLVHRVAQMADDLPQLASVTLSPCVATLSGTYVLGARVFIAPTDDRRDPMARIL
jgi:acyl-CoA synthetase (NDP forming)